ncbi:MAG: pentapeptide repeat-containing protein [Acidobacteriia bacterium]|nr:pentapeptide repeat-containing protein [Terriglobia bacterium]
MGDPAPIPDEESRVRDEKLRLETDVLKRQLARRFFLLELCKALAGPVAVAAFFWTMYIAISQRADVRVAREDERFEHAITRIGSTQVPERLTGIAGLEQSLRSNEPERQAQALQYLVNAAVIEKDPTVRSAILDIFEGLQNLRIPSDALKTALVYARDRNRSILKLYTNRFFATPMVNNRMPSGPGFTEVPIGKLSDEESAPLEATASMMAALIRAGARVPDLSQVYCVDCNFGVEGKPLDLAHSNFDGAFLSRAHFDGANLSGSSFHNADLVQTWFTGANLRGAKLTSDVTILPWQEMAGIEGDNLLLMSGANFSCADLTQADFTGRPIFTFIYHNPVFNTAQHDNFSKAMLTKTKLTGFQFLLGIPEEFVPTSKTSKFFDISSVFPTTMAQSGGPSQTITAVGGKKYLVWSVATNQDFKFTGPIDTKAFWDVVLAFRQLHAARDLWNADMPSGLRDFLKNNETLFSPVLGDPGCKNEDNETSTPK